MANEQHVEWLLEGVEAWNARREREDFVPDLSGVDISKKFEDAGKFDSHGEISLAEINFREAKLTEAKLSFAYLIYADFSKADLTGADLTRATLPYTRFREANLTDANLSGAELNGADFSQVGSGNAKRPDQFLLQRMAYFSDYKPDNVQTHPCQVL